MNVVVQEWERVLVYRDGRFVGVLERLVAGVEDHEVIAEPVHLVEGPPHRPGASREGDGVRPPHARHSRESGNPACATVAL